MKRDYYQDVDVCRFGQAPRKTGKNTLCGSPTAVVLVAQVHTNKPVNNVCRNITKLNYIL